MDVAIVLMLVDIMPLLWCWCRMMSELMVQPFWLNGKNKTEINQILLKAKIKWKNQF